IKEANFPPEAGSQSCCSDPEDPVTSMSCMHMLAFGLGKAAEHVAMLEADMLTHFAAPPKRSTKWQKLKNCVRACKHTNKNLTAVLMGQPGALEALSEAAEMDDARDEELAAQMDELMTSKHEIEKMLAKKTMKDSLMELKRYRKPPWASAYIVIATHLALNEPKMVEQLPRVTPDQFPRRMPVKDNPNAIAAVWAFAAHQINVIQMLKRMKEYDVKAMSEPELDPDGNDLTAERIRVVEFVLKDMTPAQAQKSSKCTVHFTPV
ncbi:hypothetical protein CYMTET_20806, partial [Cymbomonas tetramitiformis]